MTMIHKEEDTVVLLSPDERQGEARRAKKCVKKHTFIASSFAASCVCSAGLLISNVAIWCREPGATCKDTELIRFSVFVGGIISSIITGRAVDYYGRRSSLVFAALCWLIVTIFMFFFPTPAINHVNLHSVSLTRSLILPSQDLTTSRTASLDVTSKLLFNSLESRVSVSQSFTYSISQNPSPDSHLSPTQPSSIHLISFPNNGPRINIPHKSYDNLSVGNLSHGISESVEGTSMKSFRNAEDSRGKFLSVIPVVSHLLIGAASAASVTSASVYVYETSQMNFRARWLSLSDFFSAVFVLSLPLIHTNVVVLTTTACLPIIALSLIILLPFNIPNCLSLPHSPYHLLMCSIVRKRNSLVSKSSKSTRDHFCKHKSNPVKECKSKPSSNIFQLYEKMTANIANKFKIPFNSAKIKIHDVNSRKNSASDSDDSSCYMNDLVKQADVETELEKLQAVQIENHGWADSVHYKKSAYFEEDDELFLGECSKPFGVLEEGKGRGTSKGFDVDMGHLEEESVVSFGTGREGMEGSLFRHVQAESNEYDGDEQFGEGNSIISTQESWHGSSGAKVTWQEAESHRILTHLYGLKKGQEEWEMIHRTFMEDVGSNGLPVNKSFFVFDLLHFQPNFHLISKIGLPLLIIHMCASDYVAIDAVSETIMSKMGFCDVSAQTTVSVLQVASTGISMLILDKIGNQVVLLSAAMVMATSLMALGLLSPYINQLAGDSHSTISINSFTPNPPSPTIYPLLPTPLPQILQKEQNICIENQVKDSSLSLLNQVGTAQHSHMYITSMSPSIWLTAIALISSIVAGSLILAPLTRLTLLSVFPTNGRGSGVGISFAIQWAIRLIIFFLPNTFLSSSLGLILRAGACFSSIIVLLCFLSIKSQSRCCCPQQNSSNKRFFHLLSDGKICNISALNSTAV